MSFQLRSLTEPPVLGEEYATLLGEARAKKMRQLLDDQVHRLMSSDRMMKFLRREISDPLQCKKSHRQHIRRLLEILLNKLQIECIIHETSRGSNSVFALEDGQRRRSAAAASGDLSSQLSYQPGMGVRTVNISVNKPSDIRKHAFVLT